MLDDVIRSYEGFRYALMQPKRIKFEEMIEAVMDMQTAGLDEDQAFLLSLIAQQFMIDDLRTQIEAIKGRTS